MAKEDRSASLRNEIEELREEATALADRAKKTARQAEVLANRIKELEKKVVTHSQKWTLAAAGYANERAYLPKHYPDLRSNRNNFASEFLVCEIRSGIIALAMVAKVMPLPLYPRANCAPGKSL